MSDDVINIKIAEEKIETFNSYRDEIFNITKKFKESNLPPSVYKSLYDVMENLQQHMRDLNISPICCPYCLDHAITKTKIVETRKERDYDYGGTSNKDYCIDVFLCSNGHYFETKIHINPKFKKTDYWSGNETDCQ